jgi:hypothetical protein
MKNSILTLLLLVFTTFAFGQITQPDTTKKEFKNIIELDATGLLQQFLFTSGTGSGYYNITPYMISYKRIFNNNNAIRFGVGGTTSKDNSTTNDSIENSSKRTNFNVGIGVEHYAYLTKRWNFFFGIDAIANYSENEYVQDNTTGTTNTTKQINYGYGVSPLVGIQFKINSRISVSTETRYDIVFTQGDSKRTYIPDSSFDTKTKSNGIRTTFNAPVNINFRVHF